MGGDDVGKSSVGPEIVGFFVKLGIVMWAICGAAGVVALILFLLRVWIDAQ